MRFQVNEGPIDRLARAVLGFGLLAAVAAGWVAVPLLYAAVVLATIGIVTAASGFCPTYVLFGISTKPKDAAEGLRH